MINRRNFLLASGALCALASTLRSEVQQKQTKNSHNMRYCLNTSTINGPRKIPADKLVDIVAKAGYDGIEFWIRDLEAFVAAGGSLADLKKRIADAGLKVESAIGFANWISDDDEHRAKALEQAKREMEIVKAVGGTRIAAPPAGGTKTKIDLAKIAQRYAELLKVGAEVGVTPQLEVWGFSQSLSRLGETAYVVVESGRKDACLLPDIYHIYKGGSDFAGLNFIDGKSIHVFHMNDYPADPPRDQIGDADRVYPGDGVAPISDILQMMHANGFVGALSLELFNREYWKQDPQEVANTGLKKMKKCVEAAFA